MTSKNCKHLNSTCSMFNQKIHLPSSKCHQTSLDFHHPKPSYHRIIHTLLIRIMYEWRESRKFRTIIIINVLHKIAKSTPWQRNTPHGLTTLKQCSRMGIAKVIYINGKWRWHDQNDERYTYHSNRENKKLMNKKRQSRKNERNICTKAWFWCVIIMGILFAFLIFCVRLLFD